MQVGGVYKKISFYFKKIFKLKHAYYKSVKQVDK